MKKFTLIFAVLCLMGITAMAQDNQNGGRGGRMDPAQMVTRMDEGITKNVTGLTDAQKEKIHTLNTEYITNMSKNRPQMTQGQRLSDEEMQQMRTKMEELRKTYTTSLKSILSDSQYSEYDKYQKSQPQRGFGQRGPGQHAGGQQGDAHQGNPNN